MTTTLGVGLLLAALALLSIFRARRDGTSHPAVSSPVVSAVFPTLILGLMAFGAAVLISSMIG